MKCLWVFFVLFLLNASVLKSIEIEKIQLKYPDKNFTINKKDLAGKWDFCDKDLDMIISIMDNSSNEILIKNREKLKKNLSEFSNENIKELYHVLKQVRNTGDKKSLNEFNEINGILLKFKEFVLKKMNDCRVYEDISEKTPTQRMIACWLRYAYNFCYQPNDMFPLFTTSYRMRLFEKTAQKPFKNIINELYAISVFYINATKNFGGNDNSILFFKKFYGTRCYQKGSKIRKLCLENSLENFKLHLVWKLEKNAWRLDRIECQSCNEVIEKPIIPTLDFYHPSKVTPSFNPKNDHDPGCDCCH